VGWIPLDACWVCGGAELRPVHTAVFETSEYARQDPELAAYSGACVQVVRCAACGFGQPEALPALPGYFDRLYDQRWSEEWMEQEFTLGWRSASRRGSGRCWTWGPTWGASCTWRARRGGRPRGWS
jgi:hypothetical protein